LDYDRWRTGLELKSCALACTIARLVSDASSACRTPACSPHDPATIGQTFFEPAFHANASEYYINWFKLGSKPPITRDRLFYFYRLNPVGQDHQPWSNPNDASTPSRALEALSSQIRVSVFLTAPAVLIVSLASLPGSVMRFDVPTGITHVSANVGAGMPRFVLQRQGKTVIDKTGEQTITADDCSGAYNYFSGSADA